MTITIVNDSFMSDGTDLNCSNEINKLNIFKDLIISLQEKIVDLKDEVLFLREDSTKKSIIINNLIYMTKQNVINETQGSNVNEYNNDVSEYNHNMENKYPGNSIYKEASVNNILNELNSTPIKVYSSQFNYQSFPYIDEGGGEEDEVKDGKEENNYEKDQDEDEEEEEKEKVEKEGGEEENEVEEERKESY